LHQVGDLFQLNVKLRCRNVNVFPVVTNEIFGTSKVSKDAELRNIHSLFYAPLFLHNSWNYCGAEAVRGYYPADFFLGKSHLVLIICSRYITMTGSAETRLYRLQFLRYN